MRVEVHVLGGLKVAVGGRTLSIGGRRQRALLAFLALHANEVVSSDRIIEALWGETPTPTARASVRVAVSKLRRQLAEAGAAGILASEPTGYVLRLESDELDALRFATLAEQGRTALAAGDPERAAELLREALALWTGPALSDVIYEPFAATAAARLEEERLAATESRIDAELALGHQGELVGELESLVAAHPLREPLTARLMLALYRCGRQAEALEAYRLLRRRLHDELGLDPSPDLRELEQSILRQDPGLGATMPSASVTTTPVRPGVSSRTLAAVIAIALIALLAAAGVSLWIEARSTPSPIDVPADSVAVVDQGNGRVVAAIRVGGRPTQVVVGAGLAWVANVEDETVTRIDIETRRVLNTIGLGFEPTDLAAVGRTVWVVGGFDHKLARIDADGRIRFTTSFREELGPLPEGFERGPAGVAVGEGGVWVSHGIEVTLFDPRTGAVRKTIEAGGPWVSQIAVGEGSVWVAYNDSYRIESDQVEKAALDVVDPRSAARTARIFLASRPQDIEVVDRYVWVALGVSDSVWRFVPRPPHVEMTIAAGDNPSSIAVDERLWVSNQADATITKLDGQSGEKLEVYPVGHTLEDLAKADDELWVAVRKP